MGRMSNTAIIAAMTIAFSKFIISSPIHISRKVINKISTYERAKLPSIFTMAVFACRSMTCALSGNTERMEELI